MKDIKSFIRVLKHVFRYPFILGASIACSFLVALVWGGNIGAMYPVVDVTFRGKSLRTWADDQIAAAEKNVADTEAVIENLRQQESTADAARRTTLRNEIESHENRRATEQAVITRVKKWKPYLDRFAPATAFRTVLLVVIFILLATLFKHACLVANTVLTNWLITRVTMDLRQQFFEHVLRMDMKTMGRDGTSRLLTLFDTAIQGVTNGLQQVIGNAIREPLKIFACLSAAAFISWRLLLLTLVIVPAGFYVMRLLTKKIRREMYRSIEGSMDLNRCAFEVFNGLTAVQAYTMEPQETAKLQLASERFTHKTMRITFFSALLKPVVETFGVIVISVALLAGAHIVLNQETHFLGIKLCDRPLSVASILIFYGMLIGTTDPIRRLTDIHSNILLAFASADRIFAVLDQAPAIVDPPNPRPLPARHQTLTFEGIHFHYHADQPVLVGMDFSIPLGETLAIVGPNGCGKTTLANLIPRFYDPVQGSVRLDNIDLREVGLRDLRKKIGIVSQQTLLFDDTVFNNILYGAPEATKEEVIEAAEIARAHEFISTQLPAGYDTLIGQSGSRLSGGQRQRIALARAILRNPEILILDEATSQIDLHSEKLIQQALTEFVRDRTTIIIAHRLSTLAMAHRILVMKAGRIVDLGTHEELASRCSFYNDLCRFELRKSA